MLKMNVSQLLKDSIGSTRKVVVDDTVDISDCDYAVKGTVGLIRTDRSILVEGELQTESELSCSRCLNLFSCPLTLRIDEEYFPAFDVNTGVPLPLPDEPGYFTIDEHNILDLTEAIRQYALLAIPMKPLCREDCAGLCPGCGCNLNEGACQCPPKPVDPRWTKLGKVTFGG